MDDPHAEVDIKPQVKPRGSVAEEEDREPAHHCTSCRLNPQDPPGRLRVCGADERPLSAPAREGALALRAADTGGEDTGAGPG